MLSDGSSIEYLERLCVSPKRFDNSAVFIVLHIPSIREHDVTMSAPFPPTAQHEVHRCLGGDVLLHSAAEHGRS